MSDMVPISFNGQGLFPVSSGKARTKGQQALIEYLIQCMEKGVAPDKKHMALKIYKPVAARKSSFYYADDKYYLTYQDFNAEHPNCLMLYDVQFVNGERKRVVRLGKQEDCLDSYYLYAFNQWYKANLGSLIQQGLLFAIPTGYILKKIDATIEISN